MDAVSKTLYIPLYGKAYVSQRGLILQDKTAEAIWAEAGFPLKGKAKSKWLAYNMGMRSAVFDRWVLEKLHQNPEAAVLHLGCGMDSRIHRIGKHAKVWFDVDFSDVITERKKYYKETAQYRMIPSDIREDHWLEAVTGDTVIVVMEGISMYLKPEELCSLMARLSSRFSRLHILMDSYTVFAAKATKYKNPINEVGVTKVYGFDDPAMPIAGTGIFFVQEHSLTPESMITELPNREQGFFRLFFAGKAANKIYRLYEYEKGAE